MTNPAPAAPTVPSPARWYTPPERVTVHGVPVAYRRAGAGPPLLFLHGHWLTRRFTPFHRRAAGAVDLVAPELPGFGETPMPDWLRTREDLMLFLRDLVDALGVAPVHLAGYGLGAWFAADLACHHPRLVASLTVIAPFGLRVPDHPVADYFAMNPADFGEAYFNGDPADADDVVPGVGTPAMGGMEEFAHRYGELGAAARFAWRRRYATELDWRLPWLAERGLPARVVAAADDRIVPAAHPRRWAELLGADLVVVPGTGHALLVQAPEATADAITGLVHRVATGRQIEHTEGMSGRATP